MKVKAKLQSSVVEKTQEKKTDELPWLIQWGDIITQI
jgi:hypothetical protein